jgi:hypothetical protein
LPHRDDSSVQSAEDIQCFILLPGINRKVPVACNNLLFSVNTLHAAL